MKHPIPNAVLDDRLAFLGLGGSGKTYNAGVAVERLLDVKARVCIVDPLGAWWGLRLDPSGKKASGYNVVIFGGPHGDFGLTENSGALIGETVANMAESCILDLSEIGSDAAERRFMLAFLTALYKHQSKSLLHLVVDEADMWAPQVIFDKEGGAAQLVGKMQNVVRRGRIRGFIPWLITQRPAVLNWGVLSQVTGIVTFTLTSSQDRDAIGNWVKGQADKERWSEIWAQLPELPVGEGLVWVPRRKIFGIEKFPPKKTYDSSRAPKRGEKRKARTLKPLNIEKLKTQLATIETEAKANDPRALKAQIINLQAERDKLARAAATAAAKPAKGAAAPRPDPKLASTVVALRKALEAAMKIIVQINAKDFFKAGGEAVDKEAIEKAIKGATEHVKKLVEAHLDRRGREFEALRKQSQAVITRLKALLDQDITVNVDVRHNEPFTVVQAGAPRRAAIARAPRLVTATGDGSLKGPEQRILNSLASWLALGHETPSNAQVAWLANYSPTSTSYTNPRSALKTKELISYPGPDCVTLTEQGAPLAIDAGINGSIADHVLSLLKGPERRILAAVIEHYPNAVSNEEAARGADYSATSTSYTNPRSALRTKELITYPGKDMVRAADWLFEHRQAA